MSEVQNQHEADLHRGVRAGQYLVNEWMSDEDIDDVHKTYLRDIAYYLLALAASGYKDSHPVEYGQNIWAVVVAVFQLGRASSINQPRPFAAWEFVRMVALRLGKAVKWHKIFSIL